MSHKRVLRASSTRYGEMRGHLGACTACPGCRFAHPGYGRSGVSALVDELGHAGIHAVVARVLVLVLDLAAAILHAHVHPEEEVTLVRGEGITQAAEGDGEIARGI